MDAGAAASTASTPVRALILHGFTGFLNTVEPLGPLCEARAVPYQMPLLRGHGTVPEDLLGVTWRDWYDDAQDALLAQTADGSRAVVFGLSMGGLVALDLAARHPERVVGLVLLAPALYISSPLLPLLGLVAPFVTWWKGKPPAPGAQPTAYARFPLAGVRSLLEYQRVVEARLGAVRAPVLVVQSWSDPTVPPRAAERTYAGVASGDKELARFSRAQHDLLTGVERDAVVARIGMWLDARLPRWREEVR